MFYYDSGEHQALSPDTRLVHINNNYHNPCHPDSWFHQWGMTFQNCTAGEIILISVHERDLGANVNPSGSH